jgi:SNF2 family DNA or RNA helicase
MQLRPAQHQIVDLVQSTPRCNVFVPMGFGKTSSVLIALDELSLVEEVFPVLVVAPLRVANTTWPDEIEKWPQLRHLKMSVVTGTLTQRKAALKTRADIYVINYENLVWLDDYLGEDWPFVTVVADECSKLKGFRLRQGTKRAQALAKHIHRHVKRYIGLSGTPAPNGIINLWPLQYFVDAGETLGRSYHAFTEIYFRSERIGADPHAVRLIPHAHSQDTIQQKIKPTTISLDPADWFDLKEPIVNRIYVDLPKKARTLYNNMESEMYVQLQNSDVEAFNAASRTLKCLQIANGALYTDDTSTTFEELHDAKIEALDSVIEEASGMPVLVSYHFKSDLKRLMKAFPQGRALDKDLQTIRDWNAGKIPVLFAHPASAGHGLNLQDGGNIIAFFGHWWNLEEYQQIIERIGPTRQAQSGHNRPVFIHHIIARDTVDELIMARRESKKAVQDILLEAMKRKPAQ